MLLAKDHLGMQEQNLYMYFQHYPLIRYERGEDIFDNRLKGKLIK